MKVNYLILNITSLKIQSITKIRDYYIKGYLNYIIDIKWIIIFGEGFVVLLILNIKIIIKLLNYNVIVKFKVIN